MIIRLGSLLLIIVVMFAQMKFKEKSGKELLLLNCFLFVNNNKVKTMKIKRKKLTQIAIHT